MNSLPHWRDQLVDAGLGNDVQALLASEFELFESALDLGDEALLSASAETLTAELVGRRLFSLAEYVLRALIQKSNNPIRVGHAWKNLGVVLMERRMTDDSAFAFENAKAIFTDRSDADGLAATYLKSGLLASRQNDVTLARSEFEAAVRLARSELLALNALEELAELAFSEGETFAARERCDEWFDRATPSIALDKRCNAANVLHLYALIGRRLLLQGDEPGARSIAAACSRLASSYGIDPKKACAELFDILDVP